MTEQSRDRERGGCLVCGEPATRESLVVEGDHRLAARLCEDCLATLVGLRWVDVDE
ncbi:MAG: hypothetical protein ABEJ30_05755 [Halorientalis sp.]